jgi:RNA polymerase sigma-70 factor, ECF subfamily
VRDVTPRSDDLLRAFQAVHPQAPPELGPLLCERLDEAVAAHPGLGVDATGFVGRVAELATGQDDLVESLLHLRVGDLYLAHGCALGLPAALSSFEAIFGGELRAIGARLRRGHAEGDDLVQRVRERLFAPPRPRIADYSGQGDLRHWLRVTLVRMLIDHQRATRGRLERERLEPEAPLAMPAPDDDAEMAYLKRRYGDAFRAAFEEAARCLDVEARNLLRRAYVDGLGIDELGHLYGVHRATAARRLARARAELLSETRRRLMAELGLDRSELDSIMRLIESNVHLTAERIFVSR